MNNNTRLLVPIGTIGKSYKISGKVHYFPYNKDSLLPEKNMDLWIGNDEVLKVKFNLEYIQFGYKSNKMKIEGIDNKKQANEIKNLIVYISRDQMPEIQEEEYYLIDLVGCNVFDQNDQIIGIVQDVLSLKANDILVLNSNKKELLIPLIDDVVKLIDIKNKKILIKIIPGLLGNA